MRPIATNTNDFETLRKAGQIYVFGLSFDSATRQFVDGRVEKVQ